MAFQFYRPAMVDTVDSTVAKLADNFDHVTLHLTDTAVQISRRSATPI